MTISFFERPLDKKSPVHVVSPEKIIEAIAMGQWMEQVQYLRTLNKAEYDAEKKNLPAVTWSGTFPQGQRLIEAVSTYSQLVCLDVDKLDPEKVMILKKQLAMDEYVRYIFVSPSGIGIKFIVQVDNKASDHRAAFLHLQDYFEKKYFIKLDPSGKDVTRLCFMSWDPQLIINQNNKIFNVDLKFGEIVTQNSAINLDSMKAVHDAKHIYQVCVKWVERNKTYRDGEKNVYIHALACALNRCGVNLETAIALITDNLTTPDILWHQSVKSAYFHNQYEHGSVVVRDIGSTEFVAPPYVINYTDAAISELMTITAMLFQKGVPKANITDIIFKIAKYYDTQGWVDVRRTDMHGMMNYAINALNQNIAANASINALAVTSAEEIAAELVGYDTSHAMPIHLSWFDASLGGGINLGNVYAIIGFGGTFKSIIIQYMAYKDAMMDIPSLYLNGEMTKYQYFERLVLVVLGINFRQQITTGALTKETLPSFIEQIKAITKNNMQVYSGAGFTKTNILATLDMLYAQTGKKIKKIYMDGMAQMDWGGRDEISANIANSFVVKDIAKEAYGGEGVAIFPLIHCSGTEVKTIRNTGTRIRGGSKLLANFDGYLCTSLLVDPESLNEENPDDIGFLPGIFHLLMIDKRSGAQETRAVVKVMPNLHLQILDQVDPKSIEVKLPNKKNSYG